jgi:hypothetical protein
MARDHARIFTSIWADKDFRTLKAEDQQTYFMVLSDSGLTHCGTGIITMKRWIGQSAGRTDRALHKSLDMLCERRYLVLDWATEEVLVRSMLRNDKVFRLPNVAKSAYASWKSVHSPIIRAEVLYEVHRVHEGPADERHDKTFDDEYVGRWLHEPFPEGLPEDFLNRYPNPLPKGLYARARASAPSLSLSSSKAPESASPPPEGWRNPSREAS